MPKSILCCAIATQLLFALPAQDRDSDRDGLSDFQEQHKYFTDPAKRDSDGDGTPDGDWHERTEFTYTVRSIIQVMPSYDLATVNDDYQDARVLYECDEYVELEVVHYPLNTNAEAIEGVRDWRKKNRKLKRYLRPGITTNFDATMQKDLLLRLKKAGIDVDSLTDKQVVEKVSKWALKHAPSRGETCVWAVDFERGKPVVPASLREKFDSKRGDLTDGEMFEREIYGAGMYRHRSRGTCTTSANYLTTIMRAVGIPARCIVTVPVVDGSDPRNVEMVERRLTHHGIRRRVVDGVRKLSDSFAAHTYNEVWVGGRWRRLNYERLGQNIVDQNFMGLMTRVHTFDDLATAKLGGGWGLGRQRPSDVFRHNNPYTALTLSDRFGEHADIDNPEVPDGEHRRLTITKAYWFESDRERPEMIGADWHGARDKRNGNLLIHVAEDNGEGAGQYSGFVEAADRRFVLRAKGQRDVLAEVLRSWWVNGAGVSEFYVRIPAAQFESMKRGKRYALVALNESSGERRWIVSQGVTIKK